MVDHRLPPEVERLLRAVVDDGFVCYHCGRRGDPVALLASYQWPTCVDIVMIPDFDTVTAARVPRSPEVAVDVFAPDSVLWSWEGPAQLALRAMLDLVHPRHPDAPATVVAAPRSLLIPRDRQRPTRIKLPTPEQATVRERRLAAALPAELAC